MTILLLVLLILGVLCLGLYGFSARARAAAGTSVHLGWVGLFLIALTWLYAAWPKS
jgi:hypothetical protein